MIAPHSADVVKIGWSSGGTAGAWSRLKTLQTGNPSRLDLVGILEDDQRGTLEKKIHWLFRDYRTDGGTEWFENRGVVRSWVRKIENEQRN